ncbi:alpha/beta hydrolase [Nitriliruptoraceae bacterium ZYF776]|nr:alpha/beta hydrolase [Profundirhabdus halotolerans]
MATGPTGSGPRPPTSVTGWPPSSPRPDAYRRRRAPPDHRTTAAPPSVAELELPDVPAPTLRTRLVKAAFVAAIGQVRSRSGGVPTADAPEEELERYALALRDQAEQALSRLPGGRTVRDAEVADADVAGLWVADDRAGCRPGPQGAERVVLHLHGGAFVLGSPRTHRGLAATLSRASRAPVFLPRYRLAPEHVWPAALDDAVAAYRWLLDEQGVAPERLAVSGDSAGGGLALALLLRAKDEGLPLPACYAGLSPWTDLAGTGTSMQELAEADPWLPADLVVPAARAYAGQRALEDPLVSPLYGDLADLPPMLVHVGSDEILLDDAVRLVERAREAAVDASVAVFEGLWHVFQAFPLPESGASLREIGAFVRRHTGGSRL